MLSSTRAQYILIVRRLDAQMANICAIPRCQDVLGGHYVCSPTIPISEYTYRPGNTCAVSGYQYILLRQHIAIFQYNRLVYVENSLYRPGCACVCLVVPSTCRPIYSGLQSTPFDILGRGSFLIFISYLVLVLNLLLRCSPSTLS